MTGAAIKALLDQSHWHAERLALRRIIRDAGLEETVKWGKLCYMHDGTNVAIIYGMKNYCAVGFFKGAALDDPKGRLVAPGPNSRTMRQIRFTGMDQITRDAPTLRALLTAAKQAGDSKPPPARMPRRPPELTAALADDDALAAAFDALTPGRRRGWLLHFTGAKRPETRANRIARARPRIIAGKGPNDR